MKFTKTNLLKFWNNYINKNKKPAESNEEVYFNFIDNATLDLVNAFELPAFAGTPEDIIFNF